MIWILLAFASGCTPTCNQVCDRLTAREQIEPDNLYSPLCEESCLTQDTLYRDWEDTQLQQAFDEQRRCVMDSTCEQLADGACYDPQLSSF